MAPRLSWSNLQAASRATIDIGRAARSMAYARRHGLVGRDWADWGRRLSRTVARWSLREALALWLTPLNCVRYFEFDFARRHLPATF